MFGQYNFARLASKYTFELVQKNINPTLSHLTRHFRFESRSTIPISSPSVKCLTPLVQSRFYSTLPQTTILVPKRSLLSLVTVQKRHFCSSLSKRSILSAESVPRDIDREVNAHISSSDKQVAGWLSVVTGMVFGIVVVGGVTRLTQSGLSITEWKPVTGTLPPFSQAEWEEEFRKYKLFPEFQRLQPNMTMSEFKSIFYWEWGHRLLGRIIGLSFAAPLAYFIYTKKIPRNKIGHYMGLLAFGAAQGALGWYMVKSGLEVQEHQVPRVSPYRLCAHLSTAFTIYLGLFWGAMTLLRPRIAVQQAVPTWLKAAAGATTGLTFFTVMSGAFVAGLDAGLCYNEFPYMGEGFVPEEYWKLNPAWTNFTENSAAVQFNHRVLGITTWTAINTLWLLTRKQQLPRPTRYALNSMAAMSWLQVGLGLSTLLYFVPTPLAAAHQAGSLTLLTLSTWLLHTLVRRTPVPVQIRQIPLKM